MKKMMARPDSGDAHQSGRKWWGRTLAALLGVCGLVDIAAAPPARAQELDRQKLDRQEPDRRNPKDAPETWQAFGKAVLTRFQQRLAGDDDAAGRVRARFTANDPATALITVQVWVTASGEIERIELGSLPDAQLAVELRALLAQGKVGVAPPPDMPQPLRLRLSLAPNKHERGR